MIDQVRNPNIVEGKPISYYIDRQNQIVNEHIAYFKKYVDADVFGLGGGCPKKITKIEITFIVRSPKPVDIEKAKELIVKGYQDLLYRINRDEVVRPGLNNYPFTTDNLFYSILFADEKGKIYVTPFEEKSLNRLTSCTAAYKFISARVNASPSEGKEIYDEPMEGILEIMRKEKPDLLEPIKKGERFQW
ncbi:MAG: hypothetical protein K0S07_155 [Chlamydiales bacterium]|nr:hypothetical protein [Chlamydiales bacterium]